VTQVVTEQNKFKRRRQNCEDAGQDRNA
jgi:hypothetical protein